MGEQKEIKLGLTKRVKEIDLLAEHRLLSMEEWEERISLENKLEEINRCEDMQCVGVSDRGGVLNQLVNLNYVPLIPDGDAKRHKVYTGSGNRHPMSSLRD